MSIHTKDSKVHLNKCQDGKTIDGFNSKSAQTDTGYPSHQNIETVKLCYLRPLCRIKSIWWNTSYLIKYRSKSTTEDISDVVQYMFEVMERRLSSLQTDSDTLRVGKCPRIDALFVMLCSLKRRIDAFEHSILNNTMVLFPASAFLPGVYPPSRTCPIQDTNTVMPWTVTQM